MAELGYFFDSPRFTVAEYETRLVKVRTDMRQRDIEVLVLFSPKNFFYLTGYESHATYYQTLIITQDEMVTFLRTMEDVIGSVTMTVGADHMAFWEDHLDPTTTLGQLFKDKGWYGKRIGVEKSASNFTVKDYDKLVDVLGGKLLLDGSRCVDSARMIKSPQEIEYIRKAAKVTAAGMHAAMESLGEGVSENKVTADLQAAMYAAGGEATRAPVVSSGPMSGVAHSMHHRYILKKGDAVLFEFSGCWGGYPGPQMRCAAILEASDHLKKMADVCVAGLEAVINILKPGITSGQADAACRKVIEDSGFWWMMRKRLGYSIGVFKPGWNEGDVIDLKKDDPRVLQAGMVFHMPPALRDTKKCGVGFSETVLITPHGCEVLSDFPRKLYITKK